jgi:hypothetical protein
MHLLDRTASREDLIQWLRVIVRKGDQERSYYILHFPSPPDVLNKELTIFAGEDFVVKPVLSAHALRMHRVFSYPKNEGLPLFVAEEVKREIEAVGCTGLDLTPVPVV